MGEALNNLENLRKRSQILLAHIKENSKRIDAEVKKLHSQTLSLINCYNKRQSTCIERNINLWKLRNDSSKISAVLNPDFFCISSKRTTMSVPNMTSSGKLTLISKKPQEQFAPRKPIKECYCNYEVNKMYTRSRTQCKPSCHCRSQYEFKSLRETGDKTLTSPISCETFRRVKKIDYIPKSQFLRNVQNKIFKLQTGGEGDCLRTCARSSSYHRFMTNSRMQDIIPDEKSTLLNEQHVNKRQLFPIYSEAPANSSASEQCESTDIISTLSKGIQVPLRKLSKSSLQKTVRSKRQIPKSTERSNLKSPTRCKTAMRKKNCFCCLSESKKGVKSEKNEICVQMYNLPEICEKRDRYLNHKDDFVINNSVQEVEDLKKFREQNYFETHGSKHSLASSRSSSSLQQYLLNERLFPEPVGKIHKQDLIVTMPPCATMQKKRIHYFPRYVVRQEKNICNTNYKRKRCQNCPFTSYVIDFKILKFKPRLNSLALKYQKKILS